MLPPLLILGAVVILIAVRQVGSVRLEIWQSLALGALAMLVTGSVGPLEAVEAIEVDVILFLFGVFVLGRALEESGALADLSFRLFSRARSVEALIALLLIGGGAASAVLMNDTVAIVGVPVAVALSRAHGVTPRLTLLALAFGVTAGSVPSPIGNPQNLLIALDLSTMGVDGGNPFMTFARWLAAPTIAAMALSFVALRLAYRDQFRGHALAHERMAVSDPALARLSMIALGVLLALIALRVGLVVAGRGEGMPLTVIALVPAALVLLGARRRVALVRGVDWPTLALFVALFVIVRGVEDAGLTAEVVRVLGDRIAATAWVLTIGGALSQVVSNVPLVALYLPALREAGSGVEASMALAAGTTLAGNLTLIGAASNMIIADSAERRFGVRISFWEFARVGLPLGVAQLLVT